MNEHRKFHECPCCGVVSTYLVVPGDSTIGHPEYEKRQNNMEDKRDA